MLDDKDIALLEAYTYGEISLEAEAELRSRLAEDADFAAAVRRWELLEREGFDIEPNVATKAAVAESLNRATAKGEGRALGTSWWRYLLGVLVVGLLAYGGWSLLQQPSTAPARSTGSGTTTTPENELTEVQTDGPYADLVREYFRHLPSENFHLGSAETLEERALAAYEARDYATALPLLLETVEMGGDSLNLLYAGVAALGVGDENNPLENILAKANSSFDGFEAILKHYQALVFLQKGETEFAISLLESINNESSLNLINEIRERE